MRTLLTILSCVPLVLCAAPSQAAPKLQCSIDQWAEPFGITLAGVVRSSEPAHGTYSLMLSKSGPSGTSRSQQSGDWRIAAPNKPAELSLASMNLQRGDRINVKLVVELPNGKTVTCSKDLSGSI